MHLDLKQKVFFFLIFSTKQWSFLLKFVHVFITLQDMRPEFLGWQMLKADQFRLPCYPLNQTRMLLMALVIPAALPPLKSQMTSLPSTPEVLR